MPSIGQSGTKLGWQRKAIVTRAAIPMTRLYRRQLLPRLTMMRSRIILNVLGLQTAIDCRNLGVGSSSRGPQRLLWRRIMALRRIRIQGSHDIRSRFPMTPASRLSAQLKSSGSGSLLVLANMLAGKACKLKLSHSRGRICDCVYGHRCGKGSGGGVEATGT